MRVLVTRGRARWTVVRSNAVYSKVFLDDFITFNILNIQVNGGTVF